MNAKDLFNKFINEIEKVVSDNAFNTWFSKLEPVILDGTKLIIKVPMNIHANTLSTTYYEIVMSTFHSIVDNSYTIEYVTENEAQELLKQNATTENTETNTIQQTREVTSTNNENINNEDTYWETNLNPKLNFDNFIVGDSNRLAVASAHTVAEKPGAIHNPLFLYGKSGIGKTHLMHAIGNYIVNNSNLKVLYTTSKDYVADYTGIVALDKGADTINYANNFKNKYQNVDVLMIDDIQFLVGADKSQQEFFHTFNILFQKNKQIIISSDRSPDDLKRLEERLRSRFMMGLPVDIYPPDFELRCKIIKSKIKDTILENKLNQEVIEYIANSCDNDVRFIEGTVNRLMAYTAMMVPDRIDLNFAIEALKDYLAKNIYADNSISKIQKVVADYFGITVSDLKSKKKTSNISKPRHIAIYLSRVETDEGLSKIGLEFGGRDHSTISASYEKIKNELSTDDKLKIIVKEIKDKL